MVIKRNWSHYVDALRDDLEANHPEIGLVDFSFYNLEVFNQCEHENALLLAVPLIRRVKARIQAAADTQAAEGSALSGGETP